MISLSSPTYDINGSVVLYEIAGETTLGEAEARVSRTATLDGGAYINHLGFSHGDRTFFISSKSKQSTESSIKNLHENHKTVLVSIDEGLFLGVIRSVSIKNGKTKISILVKSKEA